MKVTKQTCFLFLILCYTLIWANYNIIDSYFSKFTYNSQQENTNILYHIDHSHIDYVDILVPNNSKTKTIKLICGILILPIIEVNISNNFISNIWQPPKSI